MSKSLGSLEGSLLDTIRAAVLEKIPDAKIAVTGGGGHFSIEVIAAAFSGLSKLEQQRLVYGAIAHLMKGDAAPVHAVDSLVTRTA